MPLKIPNDTLLDHKKRCMKDYQEITLCVKLNITIIVRMPGSRVARGAKGGPISSPIGIHNMKNTTVLVFLRTISALE